MRTQQAFYPRIFALAVAAVLGYGVYLVFAPFAGSMAWAAFLAFLMQPLNEKLRARLRGRRTAAATVLTILTPLVVLLPLLLVSIEFVAQISVVIGKLQAAAAKFDVKSFNDLQQFPLIARLDGWLTDNFSVSAAQLQDWLVSGMKEGLQRAARLSGSVFFGAVSSVFGLFLTLFLLFFFLSDGDLLVARARKLIPLDEARKQHLFDHLSAITRAIVFGTSLTALLQGLLLGIGFKFAGLPSPVVFGVLGALIAMLPIGGTALLWIPATIWLFFDGHWGYGSFMAVWGIVLSGLDNVLKPMLISGRAEISTLVVFVGVLGGIEAFGAIGTVAGPVLLSLVLALVEFAEQQRERAAVQSAP
jgi:predicted PurR-regulated permease PerM